MKLGIIIQSRMGSSRLPNKMTLPFYKGKGIFEIILNRLKEAQLEIPIVLATTDNKRDDCLEEIATKNNIKVFRGSENNVLERFIKTAEENNIQKIIRICADNPFLDLNDLERQINDFKQIKADYLSYCKKDKTPTILTSFGFWTEGVTLKALKKAASVTEDTLYLEHVTNYIYKHPKEFILKFKEIDPYFDQNSNIRLTVDTVSDFETAKEIYLNLKKTNSDFKAINIIEFVKTNLRWLKEMKKEIEENKK